MRFVPNKSYVRIDPDETQDEPLFEITLDILKHHTIYNAITLTTAAPEIYMQQFSDNNFPSGGKQTTSCLEDIFEHSQQKLNCKALGIDRARGLIMQILFTKLIIQYLLSNSPNLNKRLDSTPHSVGKEARLEKLEYVAKGEPKGKPTFRMPIPEEMMRKEIKECNAYVNYLAKYPHAQSSTPTPRKGHGKGYMCKSDIDFNVPKPKKKKDAVPRRSRTITSTDNMLEDLDQALDYSKLVNQEENQQKEKE
ncbi:hypothetical protein Tco_1236339 [Tanacetum coccineum]